MAVHPLDPLSCDEIKAVSSACKSHHSQNSPDAPQLRFNVVTLQEPDKADLVAFNAGGHAPARLAFCVLQLPPLQAIIEALIDLSSGPKPSIISWKTVEGVHCLFSPNDLIKAEAICKADAQVQKMLKERGVTDLDLIVCDPWSMNMPPKDLPGSLLQCFMYMRSSAADNQYAKPIDMVPILNFTTGKVVRIDTPHGDSPPTIPSEDVNYHRELNTAGWRQGLKPLTVVQPEGASFSVDGNHIKWQNWNIRHSFNYREGLVLHDVSYEEGGKLRPILHRASLVEMCVPYADPNPPFHRKCAFDVGDYGLGYCANSLELGCDCVGEIHYFDADMVDSTGEPFTVKKAVCLHEEDAGIVWKHTEYRTGHAEVRRGRCLVLSFIATVVNYEYAFYWSFYQDGSIKYEIKLTGELSTNLLSTGEGDKPGWGTLVAERVNSQYHQHMFCARIDMAVDDEEGGKGLQVSEVELELMDDGPDNPYGNGWVVKNTALNTESEAQRVGNPQLSRYWKIYNPSSKHPVTGSPVAWKLMPTAGPTLLAQPTSQIALRGAFSTKNLWVTPHRDAERWPAGEYTIQSKGGEGLPKWTKENRAVGPGSDPVIWHCFGVTHVPRPEDFPVMPVEHVGFMLKPFGFFNGNPAVDLPFAADSGSSLANGSCCTATNGHTNGVANGVAH